MTDHPILFDAPMVRALLEGRKTQARRVLKPQPFSSWRYQGLNVYGDALFYPNGSNDEENEAAYENWDGIAKLKYKIGDRLWVREAFSYTYSVDRDRDRRHMMPVWYWADGDPTDGDFGKSRPSIHMPRWVSRLALVVTDVRVQRLQDISEADARAEGGPPSHHSIDRISRQFGSPDFPRSWFAQLWDSINGAGAWDANPWVIAVSFDVHKCNIDRMAA